MSTDCFGAAAGGLRLKTLHAAGAAVHEAFFSTGFVAAFAGSLRLLQRASQFLRPDSDIALIIR
jgi:hypothetical protein